MSDGCEDHDTYNADCFRCKVLTIRVNTGNLKAARN